MEIKKYDYLTKDIKQLREEVFMIEQGFQEEFDEIDNTCLFMTMYDDNQIMACARYFKDEDERYYIGRVCVSKNYRHQKLGSKIIEAIHEDLKGKTACIYLDAQVRVKDFYKQLGYQETNQLHDDEGVQHVLMVKGI